MFSQIKINRRSERGQSFLELGVSLIFLLVLLTVMIDLGWAFYTMIALRDAAQEAASFGAMCPDADLIVDRLRLSATEPLDMNDIEEDNIVIEFIDPYSGAAAAPAQGNLVRVEASVDHQIIVPFAATFIGRTSYPLRVNVADTIMRDLEDCD